MFEVRKTQPKLVYSHASHPENNGETVRGATSVSTRVTTDQGKHPEAVQQKPQQPQTWKVVSTSQQSPPQQQPQVNLVPPRQDLENHPRPIYVGVISTMKGSSVREIPVKHENLQTPYVLSPSITSRESSKIYSQSMVTQESNGIILKTEQPEKLQMYRGQVYSTGNEKTSVSEKASNQPPYVLSSGTESGKKLIYSSISSGRNLESNIKTDPNRSNTLPHSSSNSGVATSIPNHTQYQKQLMHQQFVNYKQEHQRLLQQQQQSLQDHERQLQDAKLRVPGVRIQSNNTLERQQTVPTITKVENPSPSWIIPRVTVSASIRPQTLNVPSEGTPGYNKGEFSSYNPTASPRALRSSVLQNSSTTSEQFSTSTLASPATPISVSSSSPPKSILKNSMSFGQADMPPSSRLSILPRVQSKMNPDSNSQDFDFSTILTISKDRLATQVTSPQLKKQNLDHSSASISPKSKRAVTANPSGLKNEPKKERKPLKKSVTFDSLVLLHLDDEVSTVEPLPVEA